MLVMPAECSINLRMSLKSLINVYFAVSRADRMDRVEQAFSIAKHDFMNLQELKPQPQYASNVASAQAIIKCYSE